MHRIILDPASLHPGYAGYSREHRIATEQAAAKGQRPASISCLTCVRCDSNWALLQSSPSFFIIEPNLILSPARVAQDPSQGLQHIGLGKPQAGDEEGYENEPGEHRYILEHREIGSKSRWNLL